MGLTRALALEVASVGIRVNAIAPGYTRTKLVEDGIKNGSLKEEWMLERVPMGRLAKPEEIAGIACFLASDAAAYITGQVITADGGWTIQGQGPRARLADHGPERRVAPREILLLGNPRGRPCSAGVISGKGKTHAGNLSRPDRLGSGGGGSRAGDRAPRGRRPDDRDRARDHRHRHPRRPEDDNVGDILTFANEIYDQDNKKLLGHDNGWCVRMVVGESWQCRWTLILDKGQITVTGPYYDNKVSVLSVTGGTGDYNSVQGQMKLRQRDQKGTEFEFIYSLIE